MKEVEGQPPPAEGFVLTGLIDKIQPSGKSITKSDCVDANQDPGVSVNVGGVERCQANLRSETLYAVNEFGLLERVLYLNARGEEVDSDNFTIRTLIQLDNEFLIAEVDVPSQFGFSVEQTILVRQADGAVFDVTDGIRLGSFEYYLANSWIGRLFARDDQIILLDNDGFYEPALLIDALNTAQDQLIAQQVTPDSHDLSEFAVFPKSVNKILYERNGEYIRRGEELTVLDLTSGAFNNVVFDYNTLSSNNTSNDSYSITDETIIKILDGNIYAGYSYVREQRAFEPSRVSCVAELIRVTTNENLGLTTQQVARADFLLDISVNEARDTYICGRLEKRDGVRFGKKFVFLATSLVLEIDDSVNPPRLRYFSLNTLKQRGFKRRGFDEFFSTDISPMVSGDQYIFVQGTESVSPDEVVYRLDKGNSYAPERIELNGFQVDRLEPYALNSVIIYATDKSNGDAVVFRVDGDLQRTELSRDGDAEFITFQRVN